MHMRRLTRMMLAFCKKLENFEAAVALHFAHCNLVQGMGRCAALPRWERDFWSVADLVEVAS